MKEQYDNLMAYFDGVRPDLAADPIERERVSQALRRNLKAFDDLVEAIDQAKADPRCSRTLGSRPEWMSPDQYSPCRCRRRKDHDGPHACEHEYSELVELSTA